MRSQLKKYYPGITFIHLVAFFGQRRNIIKMKKAAVIIKHIFRDYDYRVDIHYLPDDKDGAEFFKEKEKSLLGPFEIVAITYKVSENGA